MRFRDDLAVWWLRNRMGGTGAGTQKLISQDHRDCENPSYTKPSQTLINLIENCTYSQGDNDDRDGESQKLRTAVKSSRDRNVNYIQQAETCGEYILNEGAAELGASLDWGAGDYPREAQKLDEMVEVAGDV
ncbi:hypothetical protein ACJ72_07498 [Emergomyces africanus]|uniref:Uncharacterized protein n=1 Tax=Emergomyces africanus TaxID=1955775 RepID=A0A1B7NN39_9EURO|nr:hypothetical protein ACJ72_07498 [Emergomyces africanus]